MTPRVALTIAGSDPSGGAGIQADLTTFSQHGVHGTSAITAVTAQNTLGVRAVHAVPVEFVADQLDAVLDDLPVAAVKTGMLANEDIVRLVADYADAGRLPNLVVDPVTLSSTGHRLLTEGAEAVYLERLLPQAVVATPNVREMAALGGDAPGDLGADYLVVTGEDSAVDRVTHAGETHELEASRVETQNVHGSGCTFAAAIAAGLAKGVEPGEAISSAKWFVRGQLLVSADWELGGGHGPIAHISAP